MSIQVTERAVIHPDGKITIRRNASNNVVMRPSKFAAEWTFKPVALPQVLEVLDVMSAHEGVNVKLADSLGKPFVPRFHADDLEFRYGSIVERVNYAELRKAIKRTLK